MRCGTTAMEWKRNMWSTHHGDGGKLCEGEDPEKILGLDREDKKIKEEEIALKQDARYSVLGCNGFVPREGSRGYVQALKRNRETIVKGLKEVEKDWTMSDTVSVFGEFGLGWTMGGALGLCSE
ncbi:hypothetical protein OG21DRAFT_1526860 [Imleria badia]|nr:hypothetical protein OG21DRAFT_1526860 [Imleria badia]